MVEVISEHSSQEKTQKRHSPSNSAPTSPDRTDTRQTLKAYLCEERYLNNANPNSPLLVTTWRLKGRTKTVAVALVLALNLGIDPPDVIKISPCARMECWIEPEAYSPEKAVDIIGKALREQYERWQPRARFKVCIDPTVDIIKKLAYSIRSRAKTDRVLFHYNGRGVPCPTNNGEIWVFNKDYTQYIPLSIYELQAWVGTPAIYVFDCSSAGLIVQWFHEFANQRIKDQKTPPEGSVPLNLNDCILLAACSTNEILPMNPQLPADIFTACLTTPIKMALRWFCTRNTFFDIDPNLIDLIPGKLNDRRTPLGELNWIFTAITDTIAWNVLPSPLFQKLFRQDLLVASLMRNFLLAERIMKSCSCTPVSSPSLPPTHLHPLWHAWDLAADLCLSNIDQIIDNPEEFESNPFFADQLTAFEVWLELASEKKKPEQLPIVLQVLLSKQHRLRALQLLARFLGLGAWAVNLALSVGIFPYILKLLQSADVELREVLVFIWTKILALDQSCQMDLLKDGGQQYFIHILGAHNTPANQRTFCLFILSVIMNDCKSGQVVCIQAGLIGICLKLLNDLDARVRQWCCLCLGKLWENHDEAKWIAIREQAQQKLCTLLTDSCPEVRTASVFALGTFISGTSENDQILQIEMAIGVTLPVVTADMSPMARKELIITLIKLINAHEEKFSEMILELSKEEIRLTNEIESLKNDAAKKRTIEDILASRAQKTTLNNYETIWKVLISLRNDPYPECSQLVKRFLRALYGKLAFQVQSFSGYDPNLYSHLLRRSVDQNQAVNSQDSNFAAKKDSLKSSTGSNASPRATNPSSRIALRTSLGGSPKPQYHRVSSSGNLRTFIGSPLAKTPLDENSPGGFPSVFYEWCCQEFAKPTPYSQLAKEDPTSQIVLERKWRQHAQDIALSQVYRSNERVKAGFRRKMDAEIAIMNDNQVELPSIIQLHPSEPMCVIVDDLTSSIHVWNWQESVKLKGFSNQNPTNAHISSMCLMNTHHHCQLIVGSDDGIVRIWREIDSSPSLATSWRALTDMHPTSNRRSRLALDWDQHRGLLHTSGADAPIIRVWDVERALSIQDVPIGSLDTSVGFVKYHAPHSALIAACRDGSIRLIDGRTPSRFQFSFKFNAHKARILKADFGVGSGCIISGSAAGDVKIWDVRATTSAPLRSFQIHQSGMTTFDVHSHAPMFVTGSQTQKVNVVDFEGREVSSIRYHAGLILGQRIGPISSVAFHPCQLILAAGATDSLISVYQSN